MAKLLRQVFGLWKKDCDFDPDFERGQTDPQPAATATGGEEKTAAGHKKAVEPQGKVVTTATSKITSPLPQGNQLPPLDFAKLRQLVPITQVLEHLQWHPRSTRGVK